MQDVETMSRRAKGLEHKSNCKPIIVVTEKVRTLLSFLFLLLANVIKFKKSSDMNLTSSFFFSLGN